MTSLAMQCECGRWLTVEQGQIVALRYLYEHHDCEAAS